MVRTTPVTVPALTATFVIVVLAAIRLVWLGWLVRLGWAGIGWAYWIGIAASR